MRKLIESTFVTLDGVISDPHVWGQPYWDAEHDAYNSRLMERAGALLLGRKTFEGFAEVWPSMQGDPGADAINALPKHVASRTRSEITAWNGELLDGDVVDAVQRLKDTDGADLLKYGTGELDRTLLDHGLLDEIHLWVFPCIAGAGDHLLAGLLGGPTHLEVADRSAFTSGITVLTLVPRGQA